MNKSLSNSLFHTGKPPKHVIICMLKMCNLLKDDRLCSKCDNNKGMSKHTANISFSWGKCLQVKAELKFCQPK